MKWDMHANAHTIYAIENIEPGWFCSCHWALIPADTGVPGTGLAALNPFVFILAKITSTDF